MSGKKVRSQTGWLCAVVFAATVAVHSQAMQFGFVNYDDPDYVTANPLVQEGLTGRGMVWAMRSTEAANWFPVTRISHMLDCQFFGLNSGWHHGTSVVLHGLAAVFLFLFLRRATRSVGASTFVALVFGVHPLHVESVAWVAERKDVLCALFWFVALWGYARYAESRSHGWYGVVVAAFCLGLMSKPMIVTLPFLLMVLDYWPLRRGMRVREKIPLFVLSAAGAAITVVAQRGSGAVETVQAFPVGLRVENAILSYFTYVCETFWPSGLAVFYPYRAEVEWWRWSLAGLVMGGVSVMVWRLRAGRPYLVAGWLWFVGTLIPVIGLVQVGTQGHADRYMYVPMVGLSIMVGWAGAEVYRKRPRLAQVAGAAVCLALVPLTWAQESYWRDSGALFRRALAVTSGNAVAEHNLGSYLMEQPGELGEAVEHLRAAVQINGDSAGTHSDLGAALAKSGRGDEGVGELETALRLKPDSPVVMGNLEKAKEEVAARHYNEGVDRLKEGKPAEAVGEFQEALRLRPAYAEAEDNLGIALTQVPGRAGEARAHFEAAVQLDAGLAEAQYNLGVALVEIPGRMPEAIEHLEAAYRLHPDEQLREALERLRRGR